MAKQEQSKLVANGKTIATIGMGPFGESVLSKSTNDAVYDDRNGKSTIAATFTLPLILVGGASVELTGRVYGRLQKDGSVGFDVSMPRGIVMSAETREAAKAHVADAVTAWPGRKLAWQDAYERLTAQPKPKGTKAAARSEALTFRPDAAEPEPEPVTEPGAGESAA